MTGETIVPGKTLLFFDEIQEAKKAILALRYFYEEMPELHVIAAGSLLEFQIAEVGVPVGRVRFAYLYPMSFVEFLLACGEDRLAEQLTNKFLAEPLPDIVHDKLIRVAGQYLAIGGMPEAVGRWIDSQQLPPCIDVHRTILESYRQDFAKYARLHQIKYVEHVFREAPRLVGQKIKYSNFSGNFRSRELSPAIELLIKGCLLHPIHHTDANGVPLGAEVNFRKFKLIFVDVGLMQTLLGNDTAPWIYDTYTTFVNQGQVAEAFVGQELIAYDADNAKTDLYYWHREARSSNAEVDYVTSFENQITPIEVKSGAIGKNKSLDLFVQSKARARYGLLMSPQNLTSKPRQIVLPIYHVYAVRNYSSELDRYIKKTY
jgi:predicted AAA+ superfamily ATPase